MKTKYNPMRRALLVSTGFFLALLSEFPHLYAEDRGADRPVVEAKDKNIEGNEQAVEPDNVRDTVRLVGPSGQEIHDFLYPMPKVGKVVTSAN